MDDTRIHQILAEELEKNVAGLPKGATDHIANIRAGLVDKLTPGVQAAVKAMRRAVEEIEDAYRRDKNG